MLIGVSWREWKHDWRMSFCLVSITAAITVPLLLLLTLRSGMLQEIRQELTGSLVARELQARREVPFDPVEIAAISGLPGVEHVEPQLRYLALNALVEHGDGQESADLIGITVGNPLPSVVNQELDIKSAIPTARLAARLGIAVDQEIQLVIDFRAKDGRSISEKIPLKVSAILPREIEPRTALIVDTLLVRAADKFRLAGGEISISEAMEQAVQSRTAENAASLRIFVQSIDWVEPVRQQLSNMGISVRGKIAEIRLLNRLDTGLTMLVGLLGTVMLLGLSFAVVATQAAWIDRKRMELSYLKLIGFTNIRLITIIVIQTVITALGGLALALLIAVLISGLVTDFLPAAAQFDPDLLALRWPDILIVSGAILLVSVVSASTLVFVARGIQPADALRELA